MPRVDRDDWVRAGLYEPAAVGSDDRRALLEFLTERGATLDQLIEAHRLGRLPAVASELVLGGQAATMSVRELAAACGLLVERVQRILLALGLSVTADDTLRDGWVGMVGAFEQGAALMGDDALMAFSRVLGAAATSIAEAAVALFYAELGPGTEREGSDELHRAQLSERAALAFSAVPEVLSGVLMAQFDRTSRRAALVRGWTTSSGDQGEDSAGETIALGFVDLVGSTSWAQGLSLRDHSLALSRFESAAWSHAVTAGGRVVKLIGDEVFFAAPTVDTAVRIGSGICAAVAADALLPPARGAVGYGFATSREGDYFGSVVNLVSRLTKSARPGTLIVTEEAVGLLSTDDWELRELPPQHIRGFATPVRVFDVVAVGRQHP